METEKDFLANTKVRVVEDTGGFATNVAGNSRFVNSEQILIK